MAPFAAEMLVYLVRWKNGETSLLGVGPEDDLVDAIDQIGDPSDAVVEPFSGPLLVTISGTPKAESVKLEPCDFTRRMLEAIAKN